MLSLNLENLCGSSAARILCLGAHADDIELGCGGTLLRLLSHASIAIDWIVFSADGERRQEAIESADSLLKRAKIKTVVVKDFKNGFFPFVGSQIKEYFEELKEKVSPDLIFTHYRNDLHQDHQLISNLTWNTFRDHLILEYEIPKYDGDLSSPNLFVHLDEAITKEKIEHILSHFRTQHGKHWFTKDTFMAILRIRGIESNAPDKYAEAFYCRKMIY